MKRKLRYQLILLSLIFMGVSCSKGDTGPAGATGATGATGAAGATGAVGPVGANGTVIYSGSGAPSGTTGGLGDFYLDQMASVLYGPKTSSGWGVGFSLVGAPGADGANGATGATGATGAAGSRMLSGSGVPAAASGVTGDYYLDKTNYLLYGPKTVSGWGAPVSFGATGPQGPPGTANVMYTNWFTPSSYIKDTVFGIWGFYHDEAIPAITSAILNGGAVLTYGKLDGYNPVIWPTSQVAQLPISITYLNGAVANIDTWSALVTLSNVRIQLTSSTNAYGGISNAHQFRCIIIPGGVNVPASIDYPGVLRYFRIKDN
ncbi:hypothetical protein ACX0G9_02770 [Flavitalea flava]